MYEIVNFHITLTSLGCMVLLPCKVKLVSVHKDNDIVKRLNKTKEERKPDLREEKEERDRNERQEQKKKQLDQVCEATPISHASSLNNN